MRKVLLTLLVLSINIALHSQNENPFAKFGYNVLTATSSKGEFQEFHDQTDIVEIGSVLFNRRTNKIVKVLDKDETTIDISSATAAMSIDPLCEKYYWISPYVYCMNNPLRYVDPDGRDGMVTGRGTKEDPYIITASYFYENGTLSDTQVKGLNAAVDSYNKSGGEDGVKIKKADGSTSYVKYNMSAQGVDDVDAARLQTGFETTTGDTQYYGNIVDVSAKLSGSGDEFGSAHNYLVSFNATNLAEGVSNGMNSNSLHKGVAIHEIGHNLGGEHSDGTSVMDMVTATTRTSQIGGQTSTSHNYPSMSDNFTKKIFSKRDTPRSDSGAGRLWTRKR
ncbi:MAG: hypothetical protein QM654_00525 [Dysgonamonadaceae bacterium]